MIFKSSNPIDREKATDKFNQLLSKDCYFELTEKKQRSLKQNRYLHLIISWFALEYGDFPEFCKYEFYKKTCNYEIFAVEKTNKITGEILIVMRSSADLNVEEMSKSIDNFRRWSEHVAGIYLPSAEEQRFLEEIEYQINKMKVLT